MAKELDFEQIKSAAEAYGKDMTAFLRAMISHPSESCEEGEVVACIKAEMEKLGFDKVTATTGRPTPTRATRPTSSSTAAAAPTRRAAWRPPRTPQR